MIVYALKKKIGYGIPVLDKTKLDRYKNNQLYSITKFKVVDKPNSNGTYYMFIKKDGEIIFDNIEVLFKERINGLEGEEFTIGLERI